jgi:hypothetical protein
VPTTPAPTTVGPTLFSPDLVPTTEDVVLPTACITRLSPTQVQNCMHIEWDLVWPDGALPDPEEIRQYIERSQHPNGPFKRVGIVPGPRAFFVDVSVDYGTFSSTWYYRIKCRRVRR